MITIDGLASGREEGLLWITSSALFHLFLFFTLSYMGVDLRKVYSAPVIHTSLLDGLDVLELIIQYMV
jgi:hypothetical protein